MITNQLHHLCAMSAIVFCPFYDYIYICIFYKTSYKKIEITNQTKIKILLPSVANTICLQSIYFILVELVILFN